MTRNIRSKISRENFPSMFELWDREPDDEKIDIRDRLIAFLKDYTREDVKGRNLFTRVNDQKKKEYAEKLLALVEEGDCVKCFIWGIDCPSELVILYGRVVCHRENKMKGVASMQAERLGRKSGDKRGRTIPDDVRKKVISRIKELLKSNSLNAIGVAAKEYEMSPRTAGRIFKQS